MPASIPRSLLLALALGAISALPASRPAAAGPLLGSAHHSSQAILPATGDLLAGPWSWFEALWAGGGRLMGPVDHAAAAGHRATPRPDLGCGLDPSRAHCAGAAPRVPPASLGCGIDPNGAHCTGVARRVPPPPDLGCGLDPNGQCR
jgi:hypothetical protein